MSCPKTTIYTIVSRKVRDSVTQAQLLRVFITNLGPDYDNMFVIIDSRRLV